MFSDINHFAETSSHLTPQGLIDWMTYIFSVMDGAAEYFRVYKIKTIGDSYFSIAGLLGLAHDAFMDSDGHTMRMLNFVSCVAQIFSPRYRHPDHATCLDDVSALSSALSKQKGEKKNKKKKNEVHTKSVAGSSSSGGHTSSTSSGGMAHESGATCVMRYGIADGPVTAGVLSGKCPAFDVWGSTVNLAARMKVFFEVLLVR